jgi:hypothetical protein
MKKSKKEVRKEKKSKYKYASSQQMIERSGSDFKPTSFKVPAGWDVIRFERKGQYSFDVLPFLAGKGNPLADEGQAVWCAKHEVHSGIGIDPRKKYVCPAKRGMGRCPVCEHAAKLRRQGVAKEKIAPFNPKTRLLMAVKSVGEDGDGKNHLLEASWFGKGQGLGEMIENKIDAVLARPKHPYHRFWHPDAGRTLEITTKKDSFEGRTFHKPTNLEMVEREEQYDESIIEETPGLDDLINAMVLPYDKLKAIFDQEPEAEEEGKGKKGKKKSKPKDEEEEDEDEDDTGDDEEADDEEGDEEDAEENEEESGDDDDDDDDDDGENSEDEEEGSEEEDGEEDNDGDDEDESYAKGDLVTFKYKKKTRKGKVVKVKKRKGKPDLISVETDDRDQPYALDADDKTLSKVEEEDDDDEGAEDDDSESEDEADTEGDDSDSEGDDEEDDESDDDDGDDEGDDEEEEDVDDEDDDVPFSDGDEDDDEEEEEKPKKKKKKVKK